MTDSSAPLPGPQSGSGLPAGSPNAQSQASTAVAPTDYETGVSNGDVDWLFRGKSKKLTKKMNNPSAEKEKKPSIDNIDTTIESKDTSHTTTSKGSTDSSSEEKSSVKSPVVSSPTSSTPPKVKHTTQPDQSTTTRVPSTTPNEVKEQEKPSKLEMFRIGRSRSSSTNSQLQHEADSMVSPSTTSSSNNLPKRRSSLGGFIPTSSPPQNSSSISPKASKQNGSNHTNNSATSDSSPNVSRSNSTGSTGGKTRSLFSSISSKFKSSSSTSSANPSAAPSPKSSSSSVMADLPSNPFNSIGASTPNVPKIQPNLLGVSGHHTATGNQDLAALVNKPPNGIPRRRSSSASKHAQAIHDKKLLASTKGSEQSNSTPDRVILNRNPRREGKIPIDELGGISMRRVTFAIDRLAYDPQQQIPSRRPKKGNVLIPEDLTAPPPRLSQGISLSDGKSPMQVVENKYSENELKSAIEAQKNALLEAEKHAQEAHMTAKRIAHEVSNYRCKASGAKVSEQTPLQRQEEEAAEEAAEETSDRLHNVGNIEIDKPLHLHENYFEESAAPSNNGEVYADDLDIVEHLSLETIYSRCCHLREILPIPATLKQLKNKSKPLQVLKLLNPKPTLIDVLSFSDFIAITPVNTIIFDNVTMTTEMLKHFLSSLVRNKSLEKLSLRNVAIDELGWKFLCKFLSRNQTIKKLDISQQRIKSDTPPNMIRSAMNWSLLIRSLVLRGGIEELVINGCKLSDSMFAELIEKTVKVSTYRLGIAAIELNVFKAKIVADWITSPDSKCVGVDIAFNNLGSGQLKPFIDAFNKGNSNLLFFSLNSTKLNDIEEASELLKSLSKVSSLKFLDLSSLPDLFPGIISRLNKFLPTFPNLRRIHFDLNDLTPQAIGAIADILPKIDSLIHVSFLGNRQLNRGSAGTLYTAVKMSKSLFTLDLDYDLVPDELSQRIAFYLMRNMDRTMNQDVSMAHNDDEEELMFDGSLLMETAEKLLAADDKKSDKKEDLKIQRLITNALIKRTRAVRKDIHQSIDTLFVKRTQGTLSLEGKETLLRFCLLDSSLEKVVQMFEEQAKSYTKENIGNGDGKLSPSPSYDQTQESINVSTSVDTMSRKNNPGFLNLNQLHDTLHESSNELITAGPILSPRNTTETNNGYFTDHLFQPHQVVVDSSSDGKDVPIDNMTGRPVLIRSISQTSVHAKEQEQEEGEFHRWGYFIQQRNNNDDEKDSKTKVRDMPTLNVLPSGSELRDAIITAKGIESVTDLIDNINNNRVSIEKIYNLPNKEDGNETQSSDSKDVNPGKISSQSQQSSAIQSPLHEIHDASSIDSLELHDAEDDHDKVNAVVDEVYEKLLNDAQRVRSNRQD